jgi:hypothetical protein
LTIALVAGIWCLHGYTAPRNVLGNTVATKLVTRFGGRAAMDEELPETAAAAQWA